MRKYLIPISLIILLFIVLVSIYNTKKYKLTKQITAAMIGALILVYVLYTCTSDN